MYRRIAIAIITISVAAFIKPVAVSADYAGTALIRIRPGAQSPSIAISVSCNALTGIVTASNSSSNLRVEDVNQCVSPQ